MLFLSHNNLLLPYDKLSSHFHISYIINVNLIIHKTVQYEIHVFFWCNQNKRYNCPLLNDNSKNHFWLVKAVYLVYVYYQMGFDIVAKYCSLLHTDGSKTLHTLLIKYYINCLDGQSRGRAGAGLGQPTCKYKQGPFFTRL